MPVKVTLTPVPTRVPSDGAVTVTVGAPDALTVTVTEAEPVTPCASLTDAVTVWLPSVSEAAVTEAPVPKAPSRDEVQVSWALRSPPPASLAVPVKVTLVPDVTVVPPEGAVIVTVGAPAAALTVTVIDAEPDAPCASVTDAVIVWVPAESDGTVAEAPVTNAPSRDELHLISALRSVPPELAVPVKVTLAPSSTLLPSVGAVIDTVGAPDALTVRVIEAEPETPCASVTEAVIVWVPAVSDAALTEPPVPRAPSRDEVQAIDEVRSAPPLSAAVPVKVTLVPEVTVVPPEGAVIVTVGAVLTASTVTVIEVEPSLP